MTALDDLLHMTEREALEQTKELIAKGEIPRVASISWQEAVDLGWCDPGDTKKDIARYRKRMH